LFPSCAPGSTEQYAAKARQEDQQSSHPLPSTITHIPPPEFFHQLFAFSTLAILAPLAANLFSSFPSGDF
jgi:hypothetical protein